MNIPRTNVALAKSESFLCTIGISFPIHFNYIYFSFMNKQNRKIILKDSPISTSIENKIK